MFVGSSERRRDARHVGDTHLSASETSAQQVPTRPLRYVPKGVSAAVRQLIEGMVFLWGMRISRWERAVRHRERQ